MSIFTKFWHWLEKEAKQGASHWAPIAVTVLEDIQAGFKSGIVGFIATTIDKMAKTNIAENVVSEAKILLPKALATAYALEAPPFDADKATWDAWEQKILDAWGLDPAKDKRYTAIATDLALGIRKLAAEEDAGQKVTWGDTAKVVEETYQEIFADVNGTDETGDNVAAE